MPEIPNILEREIALIKPKTIQQIGARARFAVSFESTLLEDLGVEKLATLERIDIASETAASKSGELVYYHRGEVDAARRALSICFWESARAAADTLHCPDHLEGIELAKSGTVYASYHLQFHSVSPDDETGFSLTHFADPHTIKINSRGE